ncbi:MAG: formylglycine-generating enzyme family protein [Devosia sp.]|uniref:formylglycine-generating enzyme family protein n=1 Tax=Devosia sp. TaxID=1871048 RepID=UPI001A56B18E|nr:formylglycine-generating enzyme family protein [Devosia sp.]
MKKRVDRHSPAFNAHECSCGNPGIGHRVLLEGRAGTKVASSFCEPSAHAVEQAQIPAGNFLMGDASGEGNHADGERPLHQVKLEAFHIDVTSVTNADFAKFVTSSGYRTEAETFGYSLVFHLEYHGPARDVVGRANGAPWWLGIRQADWAHPGGRNTSIAGLEDHPVVHVSWNDAQAYCSWSGRRLPTEAEWEFAARGGLEGRRYPWGDEAVDAGGWRANIWQGRFPERNTLDDGYQNTAPVRSFHPNGYGLWQMVGNVWEWCNDWFDPTYYSVSQTSSPEGPSVGTLRVLRGGSYLCHASYCNRYRNSARSGSTPDSSTGNCGFRTVSSTNDRFWAQRTRSSA